MSVIHDECIRDRLIRKIFFAEGLMITFVGAALGLIIGGLICDIQWHFGIIGLGNSGSFVFLTGSTTTFSVPVSVVRTY